jgi:hypothetical protein
MTFSIYASGGLQERGFFLSRIYSALVTPKYKVHFLLYTASEVTPNALRKMLLALKKKFGSEDWIFIVLAQDQPLGQALKEDVERIGDRTLGVCAYAVGADKMITSDNVLGRGLARQLKLNEAKFENFDVPNYLKSFTATLALGLGLLVLIALFGLLQALSIPTIAFMLIFSIVAGFVIYKSRYHISVSVNSKGFVLREGNKTKERKWTTYSSLWIFVSPKLETFLRLKSKDETFDLPLSRTGMPRREMYSIVKKLIMNK